MPDRDSDSQRSRRFCWSMTVAADVLQCKRDACGQDKASSLGCSFFLNPIAAEMCLLSARVRFSDDEEFVQ
jgi:hypothetical protein